MQQALDEATDYYATPEEAERHNRLEGLLQQLFAGLRQTRTGPQSALRLCQLCFALDEALRQFWQHRSRTHFVAIKPLDELLVVGIATLQGRAQEEALARRVPQAGRAVEHLYQQFKAGAGELPQAIVSSLALGFDKLSQGFELLESDLEAALGKLKAGGDLVSHLALWQLEMTSSEPVLPAAQAGFDRLMEGLSSASEFAEGDLSALLEAWQLGRQRLFLPLSLQDELVQAVDLALQNFTRAVQDGERDAILLHGGELEHQFRRLKDQALNPSQARPEHQPLAWAVAAIWNGGVPDIAVENLEKELGQSWAADHLRRYRASGDSQELVSLLEGLMVDNEQEQPAQSVGPCLPTQTAASFPKSSALQLCLTQR